MKLIILENTNIADTFMVCRIDGNIMVVMNYGNKDGAIHFIAGFREPKIVFKKDGLEFPPGSPDSYETDFFEIPIPKRNSISRAINKARSNK